MATQATDTMTAEEYTESILEEVRERCARVAELERVMKAQRDYERGRVQARGVMRTLNLAAAIADLEALTGSYTWSKDYVAGYQFEVLAAAGRP